jgi:type VI secretion system secreted protein Hcp
MFLKIGEVKGNSLDENHKDWIEITSFSTGVASTVDPVKIAKVGKKEAGATGSVSQHQGIAVTKELDQTSPLLATYCSMGKCWMGEETATIDVYDEKLLLYKITLDYAAISSVSVSGQAEDVGTPYESVVIEFNKIKWQFGTEADQWWDRNIGKGSLNK